MDCSPPSALPCWASGTVKTPRGEVVQVSSLLRWQDQLGAVRVRLSIGRMSYLIPPGLYALGCPEASSPVLVTANYKLTFDRLRQELTGMNLWILVLDTRGVNVWCAAGKGTFGTDELVRMIKESALAEVVTHRELILPQLAGPGVAAYKVKGLSGFSVVYAPVRASDLPVWFANGRVATPAMRTVSFSLGERAVVIPVELVLWAPYGLVLVLALFLLPLLAKGGGPDAWALGVKGMALAGLAYLGGSVLSPLLHPWLPGRAFSMKGAFVGLLLWGLFWAGGWIPGGSVGMLSWACLISAVTSFLAMNFTGASTYTSVSGVRREMRIALPLQAAAMALGLLTWGGLLFGLLAE